MNEEFSLRLAKEKFYSVAFVLIGAPKINCFFSRGHNSMWGH